HFPVDKFERLEGSGDRFEGYEATRTTDVRIVALYDGERKPVDTLSQGQAGYIVLARTPFYLEAGGQVSDVGRIFNDGGIATVEGVVRIAPNLPRAHRVRVTAGSISLNDIVTAEVDAETRDATRRNH